tara:strand:- start:311 stop:469 length:159 start_codon:yes stop_codon:yes gene_type:complete
MNYIASEGDIRFATNLVVMINTHLKSKGKNSYDVVIKNKNGIKEAYMKIKGS